MQRGTTKHDVRLDWPAWKDCTLNGEAHEWTVSHRIWYNEEEVVTYLTCTNCPVDTRVEQGKGLSEV